MQLIQKLRDDQKCAKKVEHSGRSNATEDIISIGNFVEVLVLNHYVMVARGDLSAELSIEKVPILQVPELVETCWKA
nr:hypothetical protein [Tanacetum cinerariifolium]